MLKDTDLVTVCSACLRACCWQGEFMCCYAEGAGTVDKTVAELRADQHGENEEYWAKDARYLRDVGVSVDVPSRHTQYRIKTPGDCP